MTIEKHGETIKIDSKPIQRKPVRTIRNSKSVSAMPVEPVLPVVTVKPPVSRF